MPFAGVMIARRVAGTGGGGTPGDGDGIAPYAGVADWNAPKNTNTILNLRQLQRGPMTEGQPKRNFPVFSTDANDNDAGYYAYPKIYGLATFNEVDQNGNVIGIGSGGWDGAQEDPLDPAKFGPKEVTITIDGIDIPFYVYVQDWPGNGLQYWQVT
jgi:hypothetical protein